MFKLFELINLNDLRQSVSSNGLSWTNSSGFTVMDWSLNSVGIIVYFHTFDIKLSVRKYYIKIILISKGPLFKSMLKCTEAWEGLFSREAQTFADVSLQSESRGTQTAETSHVILTAAVHTQPRSLATLVDIWHK